MNLLPGNRFPDNLDLLLLRHDLLLHGLLLHDLHTRATLPRATYAAILAGQSHQGHRDALNLLFGEAQSPTNLCETH